MSNMSGCFPQLLLSDLLKRSDNTTSRSFQRVPSARIKIVPMEQGDTQALEKQHENPCTSKTIVQPPFLQDSGQLSECPTAIVDDSSASSSHPKFKSRVNN